MLISQQKITPKISDLFRIFSKKNKKEGLTKLRKYISHHHIYWVGSGREALKQILLHLKTKKKTENEINKTLKVGIPAFTCHVVLDALKRANVEPIFYDSGIIANQDEIKKIIKKVDVLILSYNFGFLPEINKISQLCKKNNVILIEDCAQALGAKFDGKLAGSFGDYAFYSFGISKNIGFCGGLIASKKEMTLTKSKLKPYPLIKLLKVIMEVKISSLFFNKYIYHFTRKLLAPELNKKQPALNYHLPKFAKKIIFNQFQRYQNIFRRRKMNAEYCLKELSNLSGLIEFVKPTQFSTPAWLYFCILIKNQKERKTLIKNLLKEGVELGEMKTFRCLDSNQNYQLAKATEEQQLTFALYRDFKETKYIVKKIKKVFNENQIIKQ
jgi:dTDP-4-amino-4,6-dideoxygalactose transaminase